MTAATVLAPVIPTRFDRAVLAVLGLGAVAMGVAFIFDDGTLVTQEWLTWLSPLLLCSAGASTVLWAVLPGSRGLYELSGVLMATATLTRSVMVALTIIDGTPRPWGLTVAGLAWVSMSIMAVFIWLKLEPTANAEV